MSNHFYPSRCDKEKKWIAIVRLRMPMTRYQNSKYKMYGGETCIGTRVTDGLRVAHAGEDNDEVTKR